MHLFGFAQFSAVIALGHRATLLFDFEQGTVVVFARRGTVTLNTGLTGKSYKRCDVVGRTVDDSPGIFFVV